MMRHENLKLKLEHEHRLEYRTIGTRTWEQSQLTGTFNTRQRHRANMRAKYTKDL